MRGVTAGAVRPDALGAPCTERSPIRLVHEGRQRRRRLASRRELATAAATAGTFTGAALAFALAASSSRPFRPLDAGLLVAGFAVLSRLEFELGTGSAVPTQLLFVPMLFLLPLPYVPLLVCAGYLLGGAVDLVAGSRRADRTLALAGCAWFALPPALVLYAAGEQPASWSHWPLYGATLASQFGADFVHSAVYERLAHGLSPKTLVRPLERVYGFDLLLSPVALLAALPSADGSRSFLAFLPLAAVFSTLARERRRRLDAALEAARLEALAHTDPLTGLANRRAWEARLADLERSAESLPLAVCILDLDHFKRYNDRHGHAAGDALLVRTARAWQRELRPGDVLSRLGGEEFALALPRTDLAGARAIVERLRRCVPQGQTCSAGVAVLQVGDTAQTLFRRADEALYEAKRSGRNRTSLAAA